MTLSLYNKYRPQTFKDVVGQDHVETTLANAVEKNSVSHAYLFCGPRGTGKTTTARILAKAMLCAKAPTAAPDGTCDQCNEISEGIHPDVYELDAASRTGVDNVREEIIGRVNFAPTRGNYKIYIIDEVHMLSTPAFNALLKTLEEPPSHVLFVLCTTDVHKVPDTVQARCQRFDFKRLSTKEIIGRLQYICEREGFDCDSGALELIALRSQGGMRDAIRSLEQVAVFSGGKVSYTAAESLLGMVDAEQLFVLCDELAQGDAAACFNWVGGYVQSGSDIAILVNDLATHIRNLYAVSVAQGSDEHIISALEIDAAALPRLRQQAAQFNSADRLAWMLTVLGSLSAELKNAANARLALEVALTRILRPESETSLEALLVRVAILEAKIASGSSLSGTAQNKASSSAATISASGQASDTQISSDAGESAASSNTAQAGVGTSKQEGAGTAPESTAHPADTGLPSSASELSQSETDVAQTGVQNQEASPALESGEASVEDEQALYRNWNSVVDAIKKEKRGVAASLGGITPRLNSSGTRLSLELPAQAETSKQYLETDANKTLIRKTVERIFGTPLEVVLSVAKEPSITSAAPVVQAAQNEYAHVVAEENAPVSESFPSHEQASTQQEETTKTPEAEPSKEELDAILSNSLNSQIKFEEQQ